MVVHRYDSLSLLNQVVFVKDRPRSRLANEYDRIVQEISTRNSNDRDGALEYIRRANRRWRRTGEDSIRTREDMLERIEEAHSNDGEVLFRLAEVREADRQPERAVLLVNQAIDAGYEQPEAYLKRAGVREGQPRSRTAQARIRGAYWSRNESLPRWYGRQSGYRRVSRNIRTGGSRRINGGDVAGDRWESHGWQIRSIVLRKIL